ncbi:MlaD family protein [Nocardia terpenica]|uniref:MCE family protein n=1 Tax=Nocardia terpenica TaxID=455432 RepID=A0A6G9ZCV9_9NOCA|nr:MlaD family protein [Nocardia terpenica]QIS23378.1 MCE family protein [Nocardia terpenica]
MKANSIATLGSILAILIAGSTYLTVGVAHMNPFRKTITATVTAPTSGGLLPHSKVLLSGIEVGQVKSVTHSGRGVQVVFSVDARYRIPVSSTARIESLSGLGEPYLDFRPADGRGPYLHTGQAVPADKIVTPLSIPEIAKATTELLQQLDPAALAAIVDTFSQAVAGTGALVPELSHAADLLAATLLSRSGMLRRTLVAMQAHADDMSWSGPALTDATQPWAAFGPNVADVAAALARLIRVGTVPGDYLEDTGDTIGLIPLLHEISRRVEQVGPEVTPLVPLLRPVVATATGVADRLDLGSLIAQALHTVGPDGRLQLQISVK